MNWLGVTKMAMLKLLKRMIFKKREPKKQLTYVHDMPHESEVVDAAAQVPEAVTNYYDHDIDLSHHRDLEDYAQELTISQEALEQWISAGLLMPGELEVAEKIVKIMRKQKKGDSR
jgi:predicted glycosyltransferase